MGQHHTKKLHNKRNNKQNEKANHGMGENICKPNVNRQLISKIYKLLIQLNNNMIFNRQINYIDISKEDIQMAKRYRKRCSTYLITREKQIKTTMRYHLILVRMAIIKKTSITIVGKDVQEREPLYTVGRNANWLSHYGKLYEGSSEK